MYIIRNSSTLAVLVALLGCTEAPAPASAAVAPAPTEIPLTPTGERFSGEVRETLAAGPYTYFRLQVDGGDERWVVISGRSHRDAPRLTVASYGVRRDFVSRRLDRTFAELYFGSIAE